MSGQVLRLLVTSLLLGSAWGIACWRCDTREIIGRPEFAAAPAAIVSNGTDEEGRPVLRQARAADAKGSGGAKGKDAVKNRNATDIEDWDILDCIKEGKDIPDNWEQYECPTTSRACYIMKGTVAIRKDRNITQFKITRRNCYVKDDPFLKDSPHKVDSRTKTVHKSKEGGLTGSADITVCDEIDGEVMLCNRGVRMVNYLALLLPLVIILWHLSV